MTARKAAADKTAKEQPRRKGRAVGDNTPKETPKVAYLVREGTEEQIREALAGKIEDFDKWPEREKAEAARLTKEFWQRKMPAAVEVSEAKNISPKDDPSLAILRFNDTFASSSEHLCNERLAQLGNYLNRTPAGSNGSNLSAAVAFVAGGGAQDPVQSALLTQMAATHDAAMRALNQVAGAEYVETAQTFGNLSTKLLNVFARQAETLAKLQRGAEQTVRHVYVDARTQTAINCPPPQPEKVTQSHEQYEGGAFGPSMLGYNAQGHGVPMSGDQGSEPLQAARRKGGRSKGE